uniref:Prepilin-type N-terminal cleavage/methylation domain-containing protein n=1 Tax=candidate division CPR3 bacterium TaxID=2268181 RepID=A0A7V3JAS0_UNCC3
MLKSRLSGKSFTIVELLVVISIISLLAGLITASVSKARAKGRDAKRKADISSIQTALEMYYEQNGKYPPLSNPPSAYGNTVDALAQQLVPSFLPTMPHDPNVKRGNNNCGVDYYYFINASNQYVLLSNLESTNDPDYITCQIPSDMTCSGDTYHYRVTNGLPLGPSVPNTQNTNYCWWGQ